jgi:hypothetical protein
MTDATLAFGFLAAVGLGIVVLVASRARAALRQDQLRAERGGDSGWMSGDVSGGSSTGDGADGQSGSDGCESGSDAGDSGGGDSGCDSGGGDSGGGDGGGGGSD